MSDRPASVADQDTTVGRGGNRDVNSAPVTPDFREVVTGATAGIGKVSWSPPAGFIPRPYRTTPATPPGGNPPRVVRPVPVRRGGRGTPAPLRSRPRSAGSNTAAWSTDERGPSPTGHRRARPAGPE